MDQTPALLVLGGSSSRLRQQAAEALVDPQEIRRLLKQVRDKDRGVYKILKRKNDALRAAERQAAELAAQVSACCAALEQHVQRTPDAEYGARLERLIGEWRPLERDTDTTTAQRAAQAIEQCRQVAAAYRQETEARAARLATAAAERAAAERERREAEERTAAEVAGQADALLQLQREAEASRAAEAAARAAERAAERAAAEELWRRLGALIGMARGALRAGNTQKAARLRREITAKWPTLSTTAAVPAAAVPAALSRQLQQLDAQLNELKEWKEFAVAPKRTELIEEMESLVGSSEQPRVLAERIKSLQDEWRTTAKGIGSDAADEWERFHRAAEAAFEPCRVFFEAQALVRRQNLIERETVLARLAAVEAAIADSAPDFALLARVLREAPLEWRRHAPVEREANQPLKAAFEASLGRLQARLDAWHQGNAEEKQSLIQRARQLLNLADPREAVDGAKRLQQLWKEVAPAAREREQALWTEFRAVCDAVFEKRQQAQAEHAAALDGVKLTALALCESVERIAALAGAELLEAGKTVPELRTQFEALGALPRAEARAIQQRFAHALESVNEALAAQRARDTARATQNLIEAGRCVRAVEWAHEEGALPDERQRLEAATRAFIAGVERWPAGGLKVLHARLATDGGAGSAGKIDAAARERALRLVCIRAEIERESASPAEDEPLRREYQVGRLMQGLGAGRQADADLWHTLLLEWSAIAAVAPALHDALEQRFLRCLTPTFAPPPGPRGTPGPLAAIAPPREMS
jgi:hypothetical protein